MPGMKPKASSKKVVERVRSALGAEALLFTDSVLYRAIAMVEESDLQSQRVLKSKSISKKRRS